MFVGVRAEKISAVPLRDSLRFTKEQDQKGKEQDTSTGAILPAIQYSRFEVFIIYARRLRGLVC